MSSIEPSPVRHGQGCACHACEQQAQEHELVGRSDEYELDQPGRADPTGTTTAQRDLAEWVRGRVGRLNTTVRNLILEDDILDLRDDQVSRQPGLSNDERVRKLDDRIAERAQVILTRIDRGEVDDVLERAAEKGVRDASAELRDKGVDVDPEETLTQDEFQESLDLQREQLRQAVEDDLHDYRSDVRQLSAAGLGTQIAASVLASDVTERAQVVKSSATADASARVVNSYNRVGKMTTYQRIPEDLEARLSVDVEFRTAGDDRVCELCQDLAARDWTVEEAQQFSIPDDTHPFCRCQWEITEVVDVAS